MAGKEPGDILPNEVDGCTNLLGPSRVKEQCGPGLCLPVEHVSCPGRCRNRF